MFGLFGKLSVIRSERDRRPRRHGVCVTDCEVIIIYRSIIIIFFLLAQRGQRNQAVSGEITGS